MQDDKEQRLWGLTGVLDLLWMFLLPTTETVVDVG